jgi:hypothetical protein
MTGRLERLAVGLRLTHDGVDRGEDQAMRRLAGPALLVPGGAQGAPRPHRPRRAMSDHIPPLPWEPDVADSAVGVSCVGRRVREAPAHDVSQHRRARPVEASGEVIHLRPRCGVKARVHADT